MTPFNISPTVKMSKKRAIVFVIFNFLRQAMGSLQILFFTLMQLCKIRKNARSAKSKNTHKWLECKMWTSLKKVYNIKYDYDSFQILFPNKTYFEPEILQNKLNQTSIIFY